MIDYFFKWIEVKALTKTTSQVVKNFIWREIACWFGIPLAIIMTTALSSAVWSRPTYASS